LSTEQDAPYPRGQARVPRAGGQLYAVSLCIIAAVSADMTIGIEWSVGRSFAVTVTVT
jgi:hypothetical protein